MNQVQRNIFNLLFTGHHLRLGRSHDEELVYKVYTPTKMLVAYFPINSFLRGSGAKDNRQPELFETNEKDLGVTIDPRRFLKTDKKGRITLNLTIIRQQHGNTWINKRYKKSHNEEVRNQHGAVKAGIEKAIAGHQQQNCSPCTFQPLLSGSKV